MNPAPVVSARDVVKHYGPVVAVDRVSFTVAPGEIYALLGLNGAGKTTTIRLLLSMIKPTSGSVALFGEPVTPGAARVWSQVGYLVEAPAGYPELTVRQNLQLVAGLKRLPAVAAEQAIEQLGLHPYAQRRCRTLSLGNQQRLGLAKALLGQPGLLILDEPANGLDPAGVTEIRQLLKDLAATGTAILLSSHILAEVAKLANRIGIIHHGKLITEIAAADLPRHAHRQLEIACRDQHAAAQVLNQAGYPSEVSGPLLIVTAAEAVDAPDRIATVLVQSGCPPTHLAVREQDLESVFLSLTAQPVQDEAGR